MFCLKVAADGLRGNLRMLDSKNRGKDGHVEFCICVCMHVFAFSHMRLSHLRERDRDAFVGYLVHLDLQSPIIWFD